MLWYFNGILWYLMGFYGIYDGYPLVKLLHSELERSTLIFHGKTHEISSGPFSIANCNKLPEGTFKFAQDDHFPYNVRPPRPPVMLVGLDSPQ